VTLFLTYLGNLYFIFKYLDLRASVTSLDEPYFDFGKPKNVL